MTPWLIFIGGLFIGANVGCVLAAFCFAAAAGNRLTELPPEVDPDQMDLLEEGLDTIYAAWAEGQEPRA